MEERQFKTPIYQRKAYKSYFDKHKDDEDFKDKRRQAQKAYYARNKEKILKKLQEKRDAEKEKLNSLG